MSELRVISYELQVQYHMAPLVSAHYSLVASH